MREPALNDIVVAYASDSTSQGSHFARALMHEVYGKPIYYEKLLPDDSESRTAGGGSSAATASESKTSKVLKENTYPEGFRLFPNPANGNFTLLYSGPGKDIIWYSITNLLGNEFGKAFLIRNQSREVNCENLNPGLYIVSVNGKTGILNQKKLVIVK